MTWNLISGGYSVRLHFLCWLEKLCISTFSCSFTLRPRNTSWLLSSHRKCNVFVRKFITDHYRSFWNKTSEPDRWKPRPSVRWPTTFTAHRQTGQLLPNFLKQKFTIKHIYSLFCWPQHCGNIQYLQLKHLVRPRPEEMTTPDILSSFRVRHLLPLKTSCDFTVTPTSRTGYFPSFQDSCSAAETAERKIDSMNKAGEKSFLLLYQTKSPQRPAGKCCSLCCPDDATSDPSESLSAHITGTKMDLADRRTAPTPD